MFCRHITVCKYCQIFTIRERSKA